MTDETTIEACLGQWEEWKSSNPAGSFDEFVQHHCQNMSDAKIQEFRSQVNVLERMDRRLVPNTTATEKDRSTSGRIVWQPSDWSKGMEPVPGYRLERLVGRGGSGQVWSAIGPGGFRVAFKFVSTNGPLAEAELRSLDLIKEVKHPNLLSVFGTWYLPGYLVISTELADGTLEDRLQQAKQQGLPGIPRAELIHFMIDAAKGLDFLNADNIPNKPKIAHRDVKPQNLFTMGGGVKVGDFGLARSVRFAETSHTGSMTLAFASPDFLKGKTSNRSDQYSLAVTYYYLYTGHLLFDGPYTQIAEGHLHGKPDLSKFSKKEGLILAKALSKRPEDRWPSCEQFVEAIKNLSVEDYTPKKKSPNALRYYFGLSGRNYLYSRSEEKF